MAYVITILVKKGTHHLRDPNPSYYLNRIHKVMSSSDYIVGDFQSGSKETSTGTVIRIELRMIRASESYVNDRGKRTKCLDHEHWIRFNAMINDWLDDIGLSAEVKSSSYVIRARTKRRETYKPGDYAGVDATWVPTTYEE